MRLAPIPRRLRPHQVMLWVCTGVDAWQQPAWRPVPIAHAYVEPTSSTLLSKQNTQVQLRCTFYVDASDAGCDPAALKRDSEAHGHGMEAEFAGERYAVEGVSTLYNPDGSVHHWELGGG
ncbi:MAG: hypothetical protein RR824_12055 [Clostridia bacterium]